MIAGSRLGAEDDGARRDRRGVDLTGDDPVVERDDVQQLERLPLVLVQPLDHDIEEVVLRVQDPVAFLEDRGDPPLVQGLDLAECRPELGVVGIALELLEAVEVGHPALADGVRDELGQLGVGLADESPGRDAVGDVGEPVRP